ncbi:hypothetical protein JADG_004489 [Aureobasidium aubasidani]|nr:hypothetical protein JADG_004489 [Aureobasidium pullulans]
MTKSTSISAQNSAFQKRKQRCDQQLKNNKITFAEYQQRARWQWYPSPEKVLPIEKGQKNLKGWVGKARRKEKDSGKSGGQQEMVEDDAGIAGGRGDEVKDETEVGDKMEEGGYDAVDTSTLPRWTAVNMVSTSPDKSS